MATTAIDAYGMPCSGSTAPGTTSASSRAAFGRGRGDEHGVGGQQLRRRGRADRELEAGRGPAQRRAPACAAGRRPGRRRPAPRAASRCRRRRWRTPGRRRRRGCGRRRPGRRPRRPSTEPGAGQLRGQRRHGRGQRELVGPARRRRRRAAARPAGRPPRRRAASRSSAPTATSPSSRSGGSVGLGAHPRDAVRRTGSPSRPSAEAGTPEHGAGRQRVPAVGQDHRGLGRGGRDQPVAQAEVLDQPHRLGDAGEHRLGAGVVPVPGELDPVQLAADPVAGLQDDDLVVRTAAAPLEGGGQAGDPGADDDEPARSSAR